MVILPVSNHDNNASVRVASDLFPARVLHAQRNAIIKITDINAITASAKAISNALSQSRNMEAFLEEFLKTFHEAVRLMHRPYQYAHATSETDEMSWKGDFGSAIVRARVQTSCVVHLIDIYRSAALFIQGDASTTKHNA